MSKPRMIEQGGERALVEDVTTHIIERVESWGGQRWDEAEYDAIEAAIGGDVEDAVAAAVALANERVTRAEKP